MLVRSRLASKEEPEVSKALQEVFADEAIQVVRHAAPTQAVRDAASGQVVVTADECPVRNRSSAPTKFWSRWAAAR